MVVPLHGKEDWMPVLADRPFFSPGTGPMVVLSPHPDDETLGPGGLVAAQRARGVAVTLVAVTDGENAYAESEGLAETRVREQTMAGGRLGVAREAMVRLHLTDSGVTGQRDLLVESLLHVVKAGMHVLAPWPGDFHPDHEACGDAAAEVCRQTGARLSFYFFWTWHRGTPALLEDLRLEVFPLDPAAEHAKAEALVCHVSQLEHPSGDPILHDIHLWPARLPFEVYLPA